MKSPRPDEDSEHQALYDYSDLYERIFPVDKEDIDFLDALLPKEGMILDAGSGPPTMAGKLTTGERTVVAFDIERGLLRGTSFPGNANLPIGAVRGRTTEQDESGTTSATRESGVPRVCGDLGRLPFADHSFDAIYSRLFGIAYAMAVHGDMVIRELAQVLKPGGILLAELPITYRPKRLQGIEERTELECGTYVFRYLDLLIETPWGAVLAAEISLTRGTGRLILPASIHVFTPGGVINLCQELNLDTPFFHEPENTSAVADPPRDALRGWIRVTSRLHAPQ